MDLLDRYTPNFVWKNQNALMDHGLIIEQELPHIVARKKYEEIQIIGSNRILHEEFGDYEPFDLEIPNVSINYDDLTEVKRWLIGKSKLITHNDPDKYCNAICNMSTEKTYQNEWGVFYTFSITFRCDPLKYRVNEPEIAISKGENVVVNSGEEESYPYLVINSTGGNVILECDQSKLTLLSTGAGEITIDSELGMCVQNGKQLRTKGDRLRIPPGMQLLKITGSTTGGTIKMRGAYL